MSKEEKVPATVVLNKSYKQYDAETLEEKQVSVKVEFTPAATPEEAMKRLGDDTTKLTKAINGLLKRETLSNERKRVGGEGIPSKVVLGFIKNMRLISPFAEMTDKKEQTTAIITQVRKIPMLVETIKASALKLQDDDDDDDDDQTA